MPREDSLVLREKLGAAEMIANGQIVMVALAFMEPEFIGEVQGPQHSQSSAERRRSRWHEG
jgi:hypothetical protein